MVLFIKSISVSVKQRKATIKNIKSENNDAFLRKNKTITEKQMPEIKLYYKTTNKILSTIKSSSKLTKF